MSNYLHNLVMRSFGMMETARPRLASLFEPLPYTSLTPFEGTGDLRAAHEETAPFSERAEQSAPILSTEAAQSPVPDDTHALPRTRITAEKAAPITERAKDEEPAPTAALPGRRHPGLREAARAEAYDEVAPRMPDSLEASRATLKSAAQDERSQLSVAQPAASSERAAPAVSSEPRAHETVRVQESVTIKFEDRSVDPGARGLAPEKPGRSERENEADSQRRKGRPPEAQPPVPKRIFTDRIIERELFNERPSPLVDDKASTIRDVTNVKPETILVHARAARPAEEGGHIDASTWARTPSREQVVQVTIGRLEVRAVTPPARARAEQKSAVRHTQSLEEYLRQRAKGGSR